MQIVISFPKNQNFCRERSIIELHVLHEQEEKKQQHTLPDYSYFLANLKIEIPTFAPKHYGSLHF